MKKSQITKYRWKPKKTIRENIKKYFEINNLDKNMILDRTLSQKLNHIDDPVNGIRFDPRFDFKKWQFIIK